MQFNLFGIASLLILDKIMCDDHGCVVFESAFYIEQIWEYMKNLLVKLSDSINSIHAR